MKRWLSWLALIPLLTGCAAELVLEKEGALAAIPLEGRTSSHLLVDATVNGKGPFRFAIDSAASISVIVESSAKAAGVEPISGKRILVRGMTGSGTYPAATPDTLTIGGLTWNPSLLALLPDSLPIARRMDGLLGTDFLAQYAVAYFGDERVIRLYPREIVEGSGFQRWASIPLYEMHVAQSDATLLVFNMIVAGTRVPTILDIGAETSLMNHRAARALGVHTRRRGSGVIGATGPTIYTTELVFWEIKMGGQTWRRRSFLVAEFPVFEFLGLQKRPVAIAGMDLFRDHDFVIDFAEKRLLVRWRR